MVCRSEDFPSAAHVLSPLDQHCAHFVSELFLQLGTDDQFLRCPRRQSNRLTKELSLGRQIGDQRHNQLRFLLRRG